MSASVSLSIIARIHPEVWDVIINRFRTVGRAYAETRLNPQPLPPAEVFLVGAAETAHEITHIAIQSEVSGRSANDFVNELVDEWC
jgi:hypothetical protein